MMGYVLRLLFCLGLLALLSACKLDDDRLYGNIGDIPSSNPSQNPTSYCADGNRQTNSPYANSGESGIDGLAEETAYTICTPTQLNAIKLNASDSNKYFTLKANLDMSELGSTAYNSIGSFSNRYSGTFDGNKYVIRNLKSSVGLFDTIDGATIKNLGVENASILGGGFSSILISSSFNGVIENVYVTGSLVTTAGFYTGALVSTVYNVTIRNSFALANVVTSSGSTNVVGGLVGTLSTGSISNSFMIGNVVGNESAGGLVGSTGGSSATIENSFFIGNISGNHAAGLVGPIAGGGPATFSNNYYDDQKTCTNSAGSCNTLGGTGIDTSVNSNYFYTATSPPMDQWNFIDTWTSFTDGPPHLAWLSSAPLSDYCWTKGRYQNTPYANSGETGIDGLSEVNSFTLCSSDQLNQIGTNSTNWDKYYTVKSNINMAHLTGTEYNIIGDGTTEYSGMLNGDGNSIYNLTYSNASRNFVGLIGVLEGIPADLKNLRLVNVSISGNNFMGAAVGDLNVGGEVHQVYVSGSVTGIGVNQQNIGGVVGSTNGVVSNVFSAATVTTTTGNNHGGIIGNNGSVLSASYFSGNVVSNGSEAGGLTGSCSNSIMNSFSVGNVQGNSGIHAVGLISGNACGAFTDVYYDSTATCTNLSGSCTNHVNTNGINTSVQNTYFYDDANLPLSNWDFTTIWRENLSTYPNLR